MIYSAAYVLKGDSVDALYGEIREVANQVIQQFSLSAQQIDDVMRSEENFKSYVSSNLQKSGRSLPGIKAVYLKTGICGAR